jgi:hypothetical protein
MDRREALKKMMAGGAVVVGASMVSTSPVFAAGSVGAGQPVGTGLTTPPPTGQTVNDKRNATWTITSPNVSCSTGALQVSSSAVGQTLAGSLSVIIGSPTGFGFMPGANTATFTAVGTGPGNSPFRRGDAFQVIWTVKYECMLNGQLAGCQLVTYTYRYVNQANGNPNWQLVPGYPTASSASC